jgi:RNA polymerase sigma factor (TIGR02999 family)
LKDAPVADVAQILSQIEDGDPSAAEQLLPLVYDELRKLAAAKLAQEKRGQTLQATALVHDAYIRLVDVEKAQHWDSRGHFFAAAAEAMRRILVENARRHASLKRGGDANRVEIDELTLVCEEQTFDLLSLDEALCKLEVHDPEASQLVKLRFFAGLGHQEAAEAMGLGRRAADRLWALARAWLFRELDS